MVEITILTENQKWAATCLQSDWKFGRLVSKQAMSIRQLKINIGVNVLKDTIQRHFKRMQELCLKNIYININYIKRTEI